MSPWVESETPSTPNRHERIVLGVRAQGAFGPGACLGGPHEGVSLISDLSVNTGLSGLGIIPDDDADVHQFQPWLACPTAYRFDLHAGGTSLLVVLHASTRQPGLRSSASASPNHNDVVRAMRLEADAGAPPKSISAEILSMSTLRNPEGGTGLSCGEPPPEHGPPYGPKSCPTS